VDDDHRVSIAFDCPPEAPTTRGFAGILADGLEGASADEVLAGAPPEAEAVYGETIAAIRGQAEKATREAIPPEAVARAVEHALTAKRPRTRYPVGKDAKQRIRAAGLLPDRAFDAIMARMMRA